MPTDRIEAPAELEYYITNKQTVTALNEYITRIHYDWQPITYTGKKLNQTALDLIEVYQELIQTTTEEIRRVDETLNRMTDDIYKQMLIKHFIEGMSWEKVAFILSYSKQHLFRLRKTALKKYKEKEL